VFALGIPLGQGGPQRGLFGKRWNPIHTMLATGTDALAGRQGGLLYSDDALNMPIQSATHWDSLGHIFYHDKMYNGHPASAVDSNGASKLGIEHAKDKLVGRGVLLDVARWKKVDTLKEGEGIANDDLDACAAAQKVEIRKGDFVIVRTGQMEACNKRKEWGGYAGGDAPGLKFESCYWLQEKEVAGVCSDTWGVEVRPNETKDVNQPWHWVVIPAMGLYMGEMFDLKELAEDCAKDKVYEFFFCGAPLIIPGGTGSPINPQAIK
jgi:kynurenine formamidase